MSFHLKFIFRSVQSFQLADSKMSRMNGFMFSLLYQIRRGRNKIWLYGSVLRCTRVTNAHAPGYTKLRMLRFANQLFVAMTTSTKRIVMRVTLPASTFGWFGGSLICQWTHALPPCMCFGRQPRLPSQLDSRDRPVWLG